MNYPVVPLNTLLLFVINKGLLHIIISVYIFCVFMFKCCYGLGFFLKQKSWKFVFVRIKFVLFPHYKKNMKTKIHKNSKNGTKLWEMSSTSIVYIDWPLVIDSQLIITTKFLQGKGLKGSTLQTLKSQNTKKLKTLIGVPGEKLI